MALAEDMLETPEEKAYFESRGEADETEVSATDEGDSALQPTADVQAGDSEKAADKGAEKAEDTAAKPAEEKPDKTVPIHALHEARAQLKEQREQISSMQQQLGQFRNLRQELDEFRRGQQQTRQQQSDAEAFESDPIGYLKNQNDRIQQQMSQQAYQSHEQQQAMSQMQTFLTEVDRQKQVFMKDHPDYLDAYGYIQKARMEEYDLIGLTDPVMKQQQLGIEAMQLSQYALQNGLNPAELVYRMATHRGYKTASQQPEDKPNLQQQVEKLSKGQQAAQSLSGMTSGDEDKPLNLSRVGDMSDDDFDKLWAEYEAAEKH